MAGADPHRHRPPGELPRLHDPGHEHLPHPGPLNPDAEAPAAPAGDADLLRRSARGDRAAFRPLVERHASAVRRYLASLCPDSDRVDDVAQETFVAAWRHAGSFQGEDARPWLLAIARNALRRETRRRVGEPGEHVSLEELAREAGWGSEDGILRRLEARDLVHRAFEALPRDDREILILRDVEGFAGAEVAGLLGIGVAAQKSRLHRARMRFMAGLRALEPEPSATGGTGNGGAGPGGEGDPHSGREP